MVTQGCDRCSCALRQGWTFTLKAQRGQTTKCFRCSLRHFPMLKRSFLTAVVVGTVLTLLNQGTTFLAGGWEGNLYWKIPLTYCVPFVVVTFGALSNGRR